jgi:hypothetical protein
MMPTNWVNSCSFLSALCWPNGSSPLSRSISARTAARVTVRRKSVNAMEHYNRKLTMEVVLLWQFGKSQQHGNGELPKKIFCGKALQRDNSSATAKLWLHFISERLS